MKLKARLLYSSVASLILALGINLTGCATTGVERARKTTTSMQTVEQDYKQVSLQVDATNASLQEVISPNQIDLKKALDKYRTNVTKMEKLGKQLNKDSAEMRAKGQDYFGEWEKEGTSYSNAQIRQLSDERRLQLRELFAQIPEASAGVRGSLHSYLIAIKEIRNYLNNDLTPSGVEGITPVAQRAIQEGEELKAAVKPVLAAISQARTAMAQGGPSRGTATGGRLSEDRQLEELLEEP